MFSLNKNLVENIASILLGEKIGKFLQYEDKTKEGNPNIYGRFNIPVVTGRKLNVQFTSCVYWDSSNMLMLNDPIQASKQVYFTKTI